MGIADKALLALVCLAVAAGLLGSRATSWLGGWP